MPDIIGISTLLLLTFIYTCLRGVNMETSDLFFNKLFSQAPLDYMPNTKDNQFPHYSIIRVTPDVHYRIELAVAGFSIEELDIFSDNNKLSIVGTRKLDLSGKETYVYKGISTKDFTRTFTIASDVKVTDAKIKNGILAINLERIVKPSTRTKILIER